MRLFDSVDRGRKFSINQMNAAEDYAKKHKWLVPYSMTSHGFEISDYWLHIFQSTACGDISAYGRTLTYGNAFYNDTFTK